VVEGLLAEGRLCTVYRARMPGGDEVAARVLRTCQRLGIAAVAVSTEPDAELSWLRGASAVVPIGGHTEFADQRAAYDALPAAMKKKLEGLVAEHWIATSRRRSGFHDFNEDEHKRLPPVPQMLVRTIPQNRRKSLFVASHAGRIWGMPNDEGRALIDELLAHVTQRQFVYTHRWRPNELVMWDNRCTMHRGTDFDDLRWVRVMRRVTVSDIANSCEQEGVPVPEPMPA
jgi:alpha-ketoglutarate-dependent 2,4-dichlorophenoxyacetate dioxygenase